MEDMHTDAGVSSKTNIFPLKCVHPWVPTVGACCICASGLSKMLMINWACQQSSDT